MSRRTGTVVVALLLVAAAAGCTFFGEQGLPLTNWEPELSSDGTQLAYESPVGEKLELFVRDLGTGVVRQVTRNEVEDWGPAWSPDGDRLVFASSRSDNLDIYVIDLDTEAETRLTVHEEDDINPSWGADNRIYFNSNRTGAWEIFALDPEGGTLVQITGAASAP